MHKQPNDSALDQLLDLAARAQAAGEHEQARRLLLRATQLAPNVVEVWLALEPLEKGAQQQMCRRWILHLRAIQAGRERRCPVLPRQRRARWILLPAAAGLVTGIWAAGALPFRQQLVPGIVIAHIPVGGLALSDAQTRLAEAVTERGQQVVTIKGGARSWTVQLRHLVQLDRKAIETAYRVGHTGSWFAQSKERWSHIGGATRSVDGLVLNAVLVEQVIDRVASALERPMLDAQLIRTPAGFEVSQPSQGLSVDRAALRQRFAVLLVQPPSEALLEIAVPMLPVMPTMTIASLSPIRDRLNSLRAQPLSIAIGDVHWPVDRTALVKLGAGEARLEADKEAVARLVARLAQAADRAPQPSLLIRTGDRVQSWVPATAGAAVDQEAALARLVSAVMGPASEVRLPVMPIAPPPGELERLGLLAEIGRGESQFVTYSSFERDANVAAGGRDIDGVLVPPGAEFSFTQTVASITAEKGYQWGEMIEQGVVVPALGGGICQVSTTMFRAALNAGLPITERHPHSWRLPWYEADAPAGMDATIVLGGPDLRFRNDTAGHILIKVQTDLQRKRQSVIIYGTPTNKTVEIVAHVGSGIAITRRIHKDGRLIADETFSSAYVQ